MNKALIIGIVLTLSLISNVVADDNRTGIFPIDDEPLCVAPAIAKLSVQSSSSNNDNSYFDGDGWCTPKWECSEWSECRSDGLQSRSCEDKWECGTLDDLPPLYQECGEKKSEEMFEAPGNFVKEQEIKVDFEDYEEPEENNAITGAVTGGNSGSWIWLVILGAVIAGLFLVFVTIRKKKKYVSSNSWL